MTPLAVGVEVAGFKIACHPNGQVTIVDTVLSPGAVHVVSPDEWELIVKTISDAIWFFQNHPTLKPD